MSLAADFDGAKRLGVSFPKTPPQVLENLSSAITLRPYQHEAIGRFLYYRETYPNAREPAHLLFHMATGSGKTVIMAALILALYAKGQRNFLFFVNSTQIIEKTKANFLDAASSKYLFADPVRFDGKPVAIREVANFDEADADSINIHFTTIQGLHSRMVNPRENGVSLEDFAGRQVALISDEAHHLNAETLANPGQGELDLRASWESTVNSIFGANTGNLLLEFTATANLAHPGLAAKYKDKLLYDYSLRQFRADRYSKEITVRQADASAEQRMMQAVVLSQYRRKLSGRLNLKPVVLFKSRTIVQSNDAEASFYTLLEACNGERLEQMAAQLPKGDTIGDALRHLLGAQPADDLAREIRLDFNQTRVRNVNSGDDLAKRQIELNSLEDADNGVRCIFAVDKLNEGWDVLNLFDIVRLDDRRGSSSTTNAEAQLIGRGARYWPFEDAEHPDEPREQRKFDAAENHQLRCLETLHYHCTHDPAYVKDIKKALVKSGLMDENAKKAIVRVKDDFRQSDFFKNGLIFANQRRTNERRDILSLDDYQVAKRITLSIGFSGRTNESGAFGAASPDIAGDATGALELDFALLGSAVTRHAMDANPFFHFSRLKRHFPKLRSIAQFTNSAEFLGGVKLTVTGPKAMLAALSKDNRLTLARDALNQIEAHIVKRSHDHVGTRRFDPQAVKDTIDDVTLTVGGPFRTRWADWDGRDGIDLSMLDWFAHDDFYGSTAELEFIRFFARRIDDLKSTCGAVRIVRNEKAVKLFNFEDGAGFEPDFLVFLERDLDGEAAVVQIFCEPKGAHLVERDGWKAKFLEAIERQGELPNGYTRKYRLRGLPFFNEADWKMAARFDEDLAQYKTQPPLKPLA